MRQNKKPFMQTRLIFLIGYKFPLFQFDPGACAGAPAGGTAVLPLRKREGAGAAGWVGVGVGAIIFFCGTGGLTVPAGCGGETGRVVPGCGPAGAGWVLVTVAGLMSVLTSILFLGVFES